MSKERDPAEVVLQIKGKDVTLDKFHRISKPFLELIKEVGNEITGAGKDSFRWVIEGARVGSLKMKVTPKPSKRGVTELDAQQAKEVISTGLRTLGRSPQKPPFFSDVVLDHVDQLVEAIDTELDDVRIGSTRLDREFDANLKQVMGPVLESFGTIEGNLEGLTTHGGKRFFNVYESRTGKRYECRFGKRISLDDVLRAYDKRVAVRGLIRSRGKVGSVSIDVNSLRVFPPDHELPSSKDVRGILSGE